MASFSPSRPGGGGWHLGCRNPGQPRGGRVLDAYGWTDIPVPPYGTPTTEAFEDEVIDRLFLLNAQRAEEEKRTLAAKPAKKAGKGRGRRPKDDGQGSFLD